MFGLGFGEIVIILVVALILLGPQRLPDVAKHLGKGLREFKKATDDLKGQFESELYSDHKPAPRPSLVQPPAEGMPVPAPPPAPAATAENVPGLDAAVAEPVLVKPEPPPVPHASEAQAAGPVEPA
jgi:sec-independent protein translocase protein TatB